MSRGVCVLGRAWARHEGKERESVWRDVEDAVEEEGGGGRLVIGQPIFSRD